MPDPQSLPEICPFLASINDPDSVYNYPSGENRCSKPGGQIPITSDYQLAYCLRTRHWFCPVFTGAVKKPPVPIRFEGILADGLKHNGPLTIHPIPHLDKLAPVSVIEDRAELNQHRLAHGLMILFVVCLIGIGVGSAIVMTGSRNAAVNSPSTAIVFNTETSTPTDAVTPTLDASATATLSVTSAVTPTNSSSATDTETLTLSSTPTTQASATFTLTLTTTTVPVTLKACTPPSNWQPYTVASGETYYKIATKFNTTVDTLQGVNCLSNPGKLLAGQTIYVPPLPSTP